MFVAISVIPMFIGNFYIYNYVEPRSLLILRTAYKSRMLQKIKTMKYEHLENEQSMEIIDKAYGRSEQSARHLWPMYVSWTLTSMISSIGIIYYLLSIKWWLLLTVLIPFVAQTILNKKYSYNIYDELESYWNKERQYGTLGGYLRSRSYVKEMKMFGNFGYLINTYRKRLNERNREYEGFYFKHLKKRLFGYNITKLAPIANVIILLLLYIRGDMSIGLFIAVSSLMFGGVYGYFNGSTIFFTASGYHIKFYEYYDKFFNLSDESHGAETELPESFDIEFRDVWFRYPNTDKDILKGLSFTIKNGEKASVVGENGEGKSTMIKLLLGLFTPDRGKILVGGKNLDEYPLSVRSKIFGPVFQDFQKYSISLKENIGIGDIEKISDEAKIKKAARKGKADEFAQKFANGYDTLLGRDFEGGVDISGGQWQRIAISRAFMGDKPVLLLDEPTSQLDPMAEANLYHEFADMIENKTGVFITHRLGSTMITDRIFVISDGKIKEEGTRSELMNENGIYAEMFNAQKQWYRKNGKESEEKVHA